MAISKALSDETRVRILMLLSRGELCVCQITELLELAPSTISKHLSLLHHARLVTMRKDKRWVYYRLHQKGAPRRVTDAIEWIQCSLRDNRRVQKDIKNLSRAAKAFVKEACK